MRDLLARVRNKLATLLILGMAAGVLFFLLYCLLMVARTLGPPAWGQWLDRLTDQDLAANREMLQAFFLSFGELASLVFLAVQFLQVLLAPIPGQLTGFLGGLLFGFWPGLLLTMTGLTIGSLAAMTLSRWLGEVVVRRFVPPPVMARFDYLLARGQVDDFFMIFLMPALPDDAACFLAGLTRLPLWQLIAVCLLGRLPGMAVLTYLGSSLDSDMTMAQWLFGAAMVVAVAVWLYDDKVEKWVKGKSSSPL